MAVPKIGRRFGSGATVEQGPPTLELNVPPNVEMDFLPNEPGSVFVMEDDPEKAAEILIPYLPEDTQMLIREAKEAMQVPLWQMFLGYVMIVSDRSELFSPFLLAAWEAGKKPNEERPCGTCGGMFRSRFAQAKYCCAPCHFNKLAAFGHTSDCPTGLGAAKGV